MNWKLVLTLGALTGAALAARRRAQQAALSDGARWSAATDPVAPQAD